MNFVGPSAGAMVGIDPPEQLDPQQDLEKLANECKDLHVSSYCHLYIHEFDNSQKL